MEYVESLGHDVVLVAVPLGCYPRAGPSPSGTAFPACPSLGALLVAMDRESARHPRHALPIPHMLCPASLQACIDPLADSIHSHACQRLIILSVSALLRVITRGQGQRDGLHEVAMGTYSHHCA